MNYRHAYEREIAPRIDYLFKEGKYIEAFFFMAAALEGEMVELIEQCENHIDAILGDILEDDAISYRAKFWRERQNWTLGKLKSYMSIFLNKKNQSVLSEIQFFIELRNQCIHKLFDSKAVDLDEKIKRNNLRFTQLMTKLLEIQSSILDDRIKLLKKTHRELIRRRLNRSI